MNDLVDPRDDFAGKAFDALAAKAEPRLIAALAEHGVSDPWELPETVAAEVFRKATIETAALHVPMADLKGLDRLLRAFAHRLLLPAWRGVKVQARVQRDPFAPAVGSDCAIVMAGCGLPVAPFDKREPRLLGELSNDIDMVAQQFARFKTAYVGYSTSAAPFYILLTDCVSTLRQRVCSDDRFQEIRRLIERSGMRWPSNNGALFQHASMVFLREPEDRSPSIALLDPSPYQGSIVLYAGWLEGDEPQGAPSGGVCASTATIGRRPYRQSCISQLLGSPGWKATSDALAGGWVMAARQPPSFRRTGRCGA